MTRETVNVPRGAEWYVGLETSGEREGQMGLWIRYTDKDDCKAAMKAMFADAAPTPPLGGQGADSGVRPSELDCHALLIEFANAVEGKRLADRIDLLATYTERLQALAQPAQDGGAS